MIRTFSAEQKERALKIANRVKRRYYIKSPAPLMFSPVTGEWFFWTDERHKFVRSLYIKDVSELVSFYKPRKV